MNLNEACKRLGRPIRYKEFTPKNNVPSYKTLTSRLGSFEMAMKLAGWPTSSNRVNKYSRPNISYDRAAVIRAF